MLVNNGPPGQRFLHWRLKLFQELSQREGAFGHSPHVRTTNLSISLLFLPVFRRTRLELWASPAIWKYPCEFDWSQSQAIFHLLWDSHQQPWNSYLPYKNDSGSSWKNIQLRARLLANFGNYPMGSKGNYASR